VRWQLPGTPSVSGLVGGAGPAITDRVAVFPFASGEMVAALRQGGVRIWGATLSGERRGKVYANISDIIADPVIVDDVIYSGNQSGRAVALSLSSGARIWTAEHGAYGPVQVAGGSVFLVSDQAELVRLDAATGQQIWAKDLPYFRRDRGKRRKAIFAHFGPVLAGGKLWLASDDGTLTAYDPATGAQGITVDLPGGAASGMSFAGGTMYVMSGNGQLHAFR
jgi:outer membrane protein assembly factor BamB